MRATTTITALAMACLACAPAASRAETYDGDAYVGLPSYTQPSRRAYDPTRIRPSSNFANERIAAPYAPLADDNDGGYTGEIYDEYGQATGRTRRSGARVSASEDVADALAPRVTREVVAYNGPGQVGTIDIDSAGRKLFFVTAPGEAVSYGVGVGRPGFGWKGTYSVSAMKEWPSWTPPAEMVRRRPDLPRHMAGGVSNPLGARAMYLGSTLYRIHGSNEPGTIGTAVSSGCIRMTNEDVTDLYTHVKVGTKVVVR